MWVKLNDAFLVFLWQHYIINEFGEWYLEQVVTTINTLINLVQGISLEYIPSFIPFYKALLLLIWLGYHNIVLKY